MNARSRRWVAAVGVALGICGAARGASVSTTFDDGTAGGWSLIGLVAKPTGAGIKPIATYTLNTFFTGGRDDTGYIAGTDASADALYFSAAPAFLGKKAAYINGALSFDIRNVGAVGTTIAPTASPVILVNTLGTKALYQSVLPTVTTAFTTLSYKLGVGGKWKVNDIAGADATAADFADVLGDLGAAYILGDLRAGTGETTSIDTVQMISPVSSAPEPGTAALLLLATSCTLGRRRRARRLSPAPACGHDAARS